jgi:NAD(P)H-binding
MSASIFARTAVHFLTAVSPTDLISCFTFSVAFAAAARACPVRASILSCASFSTAAAVSSAFLARTDKAASCWESGLAIVEILHRRGLPVRALVLREDERTDALRATGVDVVVGDLTKARDVAGAVSGCGRMYLA